MSYGCRFKSYHDHQNFIEISDTTMDGPADIVGMDVNMQEQWIIDYLTEACDIEKNTGILTLNPDDISVSKSGATFDFDFRSAQNIDLSKLPDFLKKEITDETGITDDDIANFEVKYTHGNLSISSHNAYSPDVGKAIQYIVTIYIEEFKKALQL